jgi:hypothetical protein
MSRRFGRNQRRRAREALQACTTHNVMLQQVVESYRDIISSQRGEIAELRDVLTRARELAGHMSILFPATETITMHSQSTDDQPVMTYADPNNTPYMVVSPADAVQSPQLYLVQLETLMTQIDRDPFSRAMHAHVKFTDGVWKYGISQVGWEVMTHQQRERYLRRELPNLFVQHVARHNLGRSIR